MRGLQSPEVMLEEVRKQRESRVSEQDELTMRLGYVEKALADIPRERERAQSLYREGYATIDELRAQIAAVDQKHAHFANERESILARLGTRSVEETHAVRLEQAFVRLWSRLRQLTEAERFNAIHAVVSRIVVHRNREVEIDACVPLSAGGTSGWVRTLATASVTS